MGKSGFDKLAHTMRFACSQNEIVAFAKLQNSPDAFNVLRRKTPVSFRLQIAKEQFLLQSMFDRRNSTRDFARDKRFAAPRAFMVEHDRVARAKRIALPIIDGGPI